MKLRLLYELLKFWKDSKGVEGMPLKFAIIILVAALVISIAVGMIVVLRGGISQTVLELNKTLVERINEALNFT